MRSIPLAAALAATLLLSACAGTGEHRTGSPAASAGAMAPSGGWASATANLSAASGSLASGQLKLMPMGDGVHITGTIGGLKPNGTHAFHIHEKGDCSAADASSAGGHFNPTGHAHGRFDSAVHHAGDLPSLRSDAQGMASIDFVSRGLALDQSPNSVVGRGLIVHKDPDDYTTQPTGNSGARLACAVITRG